MGQLGHQLDLPEKPLGAHGTGDVRPENLDGHVATVAEVAGQVDGGHAAGAQFAPNVVAAGQGGRQASRLGHWEDFSTGTRFGMDSSNDASAASIAQRPSHHFSLDSLPRGRYHPTP